MTCSLVVPSGWVIVIVLLAVLLAPGLYRLTVWVRSSTHSSWWVRRVSGGMAMRRRRLHDRRHGDTGGRPRPLRPIGARKLLSSPSATNATLADVRRARRRPLRPFRLPPSPQRPSASSRVTLACPATVRELDRVLDARRAVWTRSRPLTAPGSPAQGGHAKVAELAVDLREAGTVSARA